MREILKKYSLKINALLCVAIVLLLILGDFSSLFTRTLSIGVIVEIDMLEGLTNEDFNAVFTPYAFRERHTLGVVDNATLADFKIVFWGDEMIHFTGIVRYGDSEIVLDNFAAIYTMTNNDEFLYPIYVATGDTDRYGFRVLHFTFWPSNGGSLVIQSVETRGIIGFRFPFSEDTYRLLHSSIPDHISWRTGNRINVPPRTEPLPGFE